MRRQYIEAGKIVNTHGVNGEVKIQPWGRGADFLRAFKRFYIDGKCVNVVSSRVHKQFLLSLFEGVSCIDDAVSLKNKTVYIDRDDAGLEKGEYFLTDLIGFSAVDVDTGASIGTVNEILTLPSHDVYVISGQREIMVPAVNEFVKSVDLDAEVVKLRLIEGM